MIEKKGTIPSPLAATPSGSGLSGEKQIEEMAKDICLATQQTNYKCDGMCEKQGSCAYCKVMAEYLYNADNRKQSEWISVDERCLMNAECLYLWLL